MARAVHHRLHMFPRKESADEDFKESTGIFEKFESRPCLDKLACVAVEIAGSDYFKYLYS